MRELENVGFHDLESALRCIDRRKLKRHVVGPFAAKPRLVLLPYLDQN
jgi:hypothetical protein